MPSYICIKCKNFGYKTIRELNIEPFENGSRCSIFLVSVFGGYLFLFLSSLIMVSFSVMMSLVLSKVSDSTMNILLCWPNNKHDRPMLMAVSWNKKLQVLYVAVL